jgi:glycosyltransferase involved in cell wall biosynthesis
VSDVTAPTSPRVILDIGPLGYLQDSKKDARGIHRVTQALFDGLVTSSRYDMEFVATTNLAGAYEFLSERDQHPEKTLKYSASQLRLSRMGRAASRYVHRRINIPGLAARGRRWLMSRFARAACANENQLSPQLLLGTDIYHSPLGPIPDAVRNQPKIKNFLTIHDLLPLSIPEVMQCDPGPMKRLLKSLSPESFVFCVSETVKADVLQFSKMDPERIFVTHLAADPDVFSPVTDPSVIAATRKRYGIPEAPYFLTLSSFDPRKNFEHVIRCFCELVESVQLTDHSLVIVGSNPERNRFVEDAIARHRSIEKQIIRPGFIPDEDLAAIYSGALAFLFPSLGEGFGIPVLEAMQCGTPVISSNATSLPEVMGEAGILLEPHDVEQWCQAIISISQNSTRRNDLRQKGLERATFFSWKKFMEATENGYAAAIR